MIITSSQRVLACALGLGLMFAALFGIGSASSGSSIAVNASDGETRQPRSVHPGSVRTTFDPLLSILGFLFGAPTGSLIGFLWGRRGIAGVAGAVLVAAVCGFAGMMIAGLVGSETRVTVSGNSVGMEHGPAPAVLIGGAVVGFVLGTLIAWRLRPADPLPPRLPQN